MSVIIANTGALVHELDSRDNVLRECEEKWNLGMSEGSYYSLKSLWGAVNKGDFSEFQSFRAGLDACLAVKIPPAFYTWLLNTPFNTVVKQVTFWIAVDLFLHPKAVAYEKIRIYGPVFNEALRAAKNDSRFKWMLRLHDDDTFAEDYKSPHWKEDWFQEELEVKHARERQRSTEKEKVYTLAAEDYCGCAMPAILSKPGPISSCGSGEDWGRLNTDFSSIRGAIYWLVPGGHYERSPDQDIIVHMLRNNIPFMDEDLGLFHDYSQPKISHTVYLIRDDVNGRYKIGYTASDPLSRLSTLQTGNPHKLSLAGSFACEGRSTERALHALFDKYRTHGEWFAIADHDARCILNSAFRQERGIV